MNIFIYDDFVNQNKYTNTLAQIETRITDLGLNGKIIRLGLLKNVFDAIDNELKRGAKSFIAVGNNETVNKILNALLKSNNSSANLPPIGVIPLGNNISISESIGVNSWQEACDILSARRIENINVGIAGNHFFLSSIKVTNTDTIINIDDNFTIEPTFKGEVCVANLTNEFVPHNLNINPQDNKLELIIQNYKKKIFFKTDNGDVSLFNFKKLNLINKNQPIIADDFLQIASPVEVKILNKNINIIVGKERYF